ncbi:uncharacterized protein H6S33_000597 [Morchella sextelata]|jgi:hypothetical protein|uniref:uncharacterized protein n=1 Tax=Morchella sextelata TaxID=1174677 RepID=UPI001D03A244|nr:uncharacterized protein H6S33_000597 [Morchella sextelata]KAH0614961.1 hypothetical protein H6S33_000597 [Morchella sextelata]
MFDGFGEYHESILVLMGLVTLLARMTAIVGSTALDASNVKLRVVWAETTSSTVPIGHDDSRKVVKV